VSVDSAESVSVATRGPASREVTLPARVFLLANLAPLLVRRSLPVLFTGVPRFREAGGGLRGFR
jgi:hypothetical protein